MPCYVHVHVPISCCCFSERKLAEHTNMETIASMGHGGAFDPALSGLDSGSLQQGWQGFLLMFL